MRVLLITPPMTQVNAAYAATPALAGFLRSRGLATVAQTDLSLELALRLFSRRGVQAVTSALRRQKRVRSKRSVTSFLAQAANYARQVDGVIRFLQGRRPALAPRLAEFGFLPQGPRFDVLEEQHRAGMLDEVLGVMSVEDRARYFASLFIDDVVDAIRDGLDPHFQLSRYAEKLAVSAPSFAPLRRDLEKPTLIGRMIDNLARGAVKRHRPELVAITIPFPGCVYGAFRIARAIKRASPRTRVAIGGGYVSTELRGLAEPAVFDYVDYVMLDDGELPLLRLIGHLEGRGDETTLRRTFVRRGRVVAYIEGEGADMPFAERGAARWKGLPLERYFSMMEVPNPVMSLWSDGRWNKLMLAHGCYWKRCAFCDTSLDYIRRFEPAPAGELADRIARAVRETGRPGFHFTDEAASPALLKALAKELVRRKLGVTWWGNIRLERAFDDEAARWLARSGCVAVTAGLETASDRTLALMDKGVTVEQAVRVLSAFHRAGIMVHLYLMYGFPTQTEQELVDALELVRQLFAAGLIQSAYWHRFALTAHSPMAREPARFGIELLPERRATFARNEIPYRDLGGVDYGRFGPALQRATYNFIHAVGWDDDVRAWFNFRVPLTTLRPDAVRRMSR